jgi:NADPH-dependent glutamate synthase beta subunit-like oxidoreductase/formate hydrogenlyase subunit 6/NADH:ubiquinone oxidoreductase subunit I
MSQKSDSGTPSGVAIIGNSAAAIQATFTLAQMGIAVKFITDAMSLGWDESDSSQERCYLWPLLLRVASHPLVHLYSGAEVESIKGKKGNFKIAAVRRPRYVREELCTSCGRCQTECSARITSLAGGQRIQHTAIHAPLFASKAVPSAYIIEKNGIAPCQVACPLGINVQGFVSLLANGKTDRALALINETAPFAATLGRVCRHPCELKCSRGKLDSPVFIRALHRYAADNAPGGITYQRKSAAGSHPERIAIVGAGPSGLTAAWELARRGYSPVVFEAHSVVGGMLATGIPRFRLPKEVREKEIEAIKAMGVDIRTGITVGRDVTFAYLKERGYRAFFLAIGAHQNNQLNIPGEEIEGVVDCISLLLTLNLMRDTFVGQNIVVIGDGNSAIDSARAAIRRNQGTVKILSWTIPDEITAGEEEVQEALQEGVSIEHCIVPVEILGDGHVTGVRCQRTRLSEEIMPNGRHRPVPIPGTDFVIEADHVVVAIGQSPNTSQLDMEGLAINEKTGVIQVDPLTLATSIPGVFAGGDSITGPNNVVSAMADGLRAAESIDRYLRGRNLAEGRSLEPQPAAEIDVGAIEATPYERAGMPVIGTQQRMSSFEETVTGLLANDAQREAQRCLNCALCSGCLECARVCETGAVFHEDAVTHLELAAQVVLTFPGDSIRNVDKFLSSGNKKEAVQKVGHHNGDLAQALTEGMAAAWQAASELRQIEAWESRAQGTAGQGAVMAQPHPIRLPADRRRIGIFLCRCGGSIDSVIDFSRLAVELSGRDEVACIQEVAEACTEAGAEQIASQVADSRLDGLVLAACRCCGLEQVCYSCTDRRRLCQHLLQRHLGSTRSITPEFVNIREQCAWIHKDDPEGATLKALDSILSGLAYAQHRPVTAPGKKLGSSSALVIGGGVSSIAAARALASLGYRVDLVTRKQNKGAKTPEPAQMAVRPWPDNLELRGSPGNYELVVNYRGHLDSITAGAVLVDVAELNRGGGATGLLERVTSRARNAGSSASDILWETTLEGASSLFLLTDGAKSLDAQRKRGLAAAARVAAYLEQEIVLPRAMSVSIDSRLCRGCGDCAAICPYIGLEEDQHGKVVAHVHDGLCLGCGACVSICPTGAIKQLYQSDGQIVSVLRSVLQHEVPKEVTGVVL